MNISIANLVKASGAKLKGLSPVGGYDSQLPFKRRYSFFHTQNQEPGIDDKDEQLDTFGEERSVAALLF